MNIRVFCYSTALVADPTFTSPSSMVYSLFDQTLTIDGDTLNTIDMLLGPYIQDVPSFDKFPLQCDPPVQKQFMIRITKPDATFVDSVGQATSAAVDVDYLSKLFTVHQNTDVFLTGNYLVEVYATAL